MKEKKKKKNGNIRTRKSAVPPQGHQPIHRLFESRAEQSETLFVFCGPALRGWLPFTPIESTSPISLTLSPSLSLTLSRFSFQRDDGQQHEAILLSFLLDFSPQRRKRGISVWRRCALTMSFSTLRTTLPDASSLSLSLSLARSSQDVQRIVHVPYFYERRAFVTRCRCKLKTPTD